MAYVNDIPRLDNSRIQPGALKKKAVPSTSSSRSPDIIASIAPQADTHSEDESETGGLPRWQRVYDEPFCEAVVLTWDGSGPRK